MFVLGWIILCHFSAQAQDYPFLLTDSKFKANEHPTSIASAGRFVATAGIYENDYKVLDRNYNGYYSVPCYTCNPYLSAFVTLRDENSGSTWTATMFIDNKQSRINNRVDVQSVPQVDVASNGDVYVSFTYVGDINVMDAQGQVVQINPIGGDYDIAIFKFDQNGNYVWHVVEGSPANDFITHLDFNEDNNLLGIAGYVQGNGPDLILNQGGLGGHPIQSVSTASPTGADFGNAFAAIYRDFGGSASAQWATEVDDYSYSHDVAVASGGEVYLSGFALSTNRLAGTRVSGKFNCNNFELQYFLVGFRPNGAPSWAELYGTPNNELSIAPLLRSSSLAIHPKHNEVYHAIVSGGGKCPYFSTFGTYVNRIDPNNGAVLQSIPVGLDRNAYAAAASFSPKGSPLYNPNIDVIRSQSSSTKVVEISGNFLLGDGSIAPGIQVGFEELEIGNTQLHISNTHSGANGASEATGFYAAVVHFNGSPQLFNVNINPTYMPVLSNATYRKIPVYGLAYFDYHDFYYTVLGFESGRFEVGPIGYNGPTVQYNNQTGQQQFDGLVLRYTIGGGGYYRPAATDPATTGQLSELGNNSRWTAQPNPAAGGSQLILEGLQTTVEQIQLLDLTGRVLQTWTTTVGDQMTLQLGADLIPGMYFIRTIRADQKGESMPIVIQ